MTIKCPICHEPIMWSCEHVIQPYDHKGVAYLARYTQINTTMIIKEEPSAQFNFKYRSQTFLFKLDGYHILTKDRVEKLLLLK